MPRYIPPREALGEYMHSPAGDAFVREFLASNGVEMLEDLLDNGTLPYVGSRWQQKLLAAFREPAIAETRGVDHERFDFIDQ